MREYRHSRRCPPPSCSSILAHLSQRLMNSSRVRGANRMRRRWAGLHEPHRGSIPTVRPRFRAVHRSRPWRGVASPELAGSPGVGRSAGDRRPARRAGGAPRDNPDTNVALNRYGGSFGQTYVHIRGHSGHSISENYSRCESFLGQGTLNPDPRQSAPSRGTSRIGPLGGPRRRTREARPGDG